MKKLIALILVALTVLALASCKDKTPAEEPSPVPTATVAPTETPTLEPSPSPSPSPSPTPTPYDGFSNPLTGLPTETDISKNRPYAIMLNNRQIAQPQLGVSKADVLFECPVEGGITRMLAVFQDVSNIGTIGSVRSSRLYYVDIAQGYDAVYIYAGGSPQAYSALKSRGIDGVDGVNGKHQEIFWRDKDRRASMGYEHSLVTSGERIMKYLPTYGFRLEHKDGYDYAPKFAPDAVIPEATVTPTATSTPSSTSTAAVTATPKVTPTATPIPANIAVNVNVRFSNAKSTTLIYNADTGLYAMSQFGGEHKDGDDGALVAFANALVLRAPIGQISGDTEGRLDVSLAGGSGAGTLFIGGKTCDITWSKKDASSPIVYKLEDGTEPTFRSGKTYVAVISKDMKVTVA